MLLLFFTLKDAQSQEQDLAQKCSSFGPLCTDMTLPGVFPHFCDACRRLQPFHHFHPTGLHQAFTRQCVIGAPGSHHRFHVKTNASNIQDIAQHDVLGRSTARPDGFVDRRRCMPRLSLVERSRRRCRIWSIASGHGEREVEERDTIQKDKKASSDRGVQGWKQRNRWTKYDLDLFWSDMHSQSLS